MLYLPLLMKIPGIGELHAVAFTKDRAEAEKVKVYLEKLYNTKIQIKNNFPVEFYADPEKNP